MFGLLGGDPAGFPNGRRVADNVVAIELRAIAGVTYPLIDSTFKPDPAAGLLTDGLTPASVSAPLSASSPTSGFRTAVSTTRPDPRYSPGRASTRAWPGVRSYPRRFTS